MILVDTSAWVVCALSHAVELLAADRDFRAISEAGIRLLIASDA